MIFLSDGSTYDLISIAAGGSARPFISEIPSEDYKMRLCNGQAIFAQAIKMMVHCANLAMINAHLTPADIQHFVPHQANVRMTKNTAQQLGISAAKII